ncbi:HlyD family type I secretion periplasmic adaptor subunit [Roseateles chitinivorans]|uniref:HlyD family type I secretion periplasmic adaptor subunit n=1 Tax=Roseateles chitinivorans TaxID=2917965 RepID=UPI003D669C3E
MAAEAATPGRLIALAPEALDFAPDLLALQERPPSRMPRTIAVTLVTLVLLLLGWACFFQLDIVASAEGRLVPLTFTKVVQPADAGVVAEILVADGQAVQAGQLLMRMDERLSTADTTALKKDVALRRLTLRRIDAEMSDRPMLPGKGDPVELYAQVEGQFRARRQAYQDSVAQETEAMNKARADLLAAQQVLSKLSQTLPSYRQSADAYRKLVQEGFVGELAANEKTREAIEKEQDLKTQAATVASLNATIAQSEKRLAALRSQYRSQLENERMETVALLNRSDQELEKSNVKAGLLDIRAPTSGVVKDLATTTQGAVVQAGAVLMNIVPKEEPLQAEVLLKNEDVGFTANGQKVKVKVGAYSFQKYGLMDGEVAMISPDATDPKQQVQGQPALTYRAIVRLKDTALVDPRSGERYPLNAGMLVTAEIHQGRRTVMEYLLSPVQKVVQESARER